MDIQSLDDEYLKLKEDTLKSFSYTEGLVSNFKSNLNKLDLEVSNMRDKHELMSSLAMVLDNLIDNNNKETLEYFKSLINDGLKLAFPSTQFSLDMVYTVSGNLPSIKIQVNKDGKIQPLEDAQSGGILEIISFLFRVLLITKKDYARFIILDEALNGVSELNDHSKNTSNLLNNICNKKGFNLLLVTHKEGLCYNADTVYEAQKIIQDNEEVVFFKRIIKE